MKRLIACLALSALAACDKPAEHMSSSGVDPSSAPPASAAPKSVLSATPAPTETASAAPTPPTTTATAVTTALTTSKSKDAGAPSVALKSASKHVSGKNYALDVTSPGCRSGEDCAMTIKIVAGGDYHVNKEYPYKFLAAPAPNVTFLGRSDANTFTRSAGDFAEQGEKTGTMTVRFKPASAGEAKVAGKYKLSVCSADQCQIEEEAIDLAVTVM